MPAVSRLPAASSPALRRRLWLGLLLVLVMATAVLLFLTHHILAFQHFPFDSDEANHALPALQMALALDVGNLGEFFQRLTAQNFYPPGVTWLKAVVFWLWGGTAVTARLFSAVCLFLAMPVLYAICLEIDERYGWLSGSIAAGLTLIMTSLLVNGTLVMLETPGLLVSLLALWAYVRAGKRPSSGRLLLTSFCLILTVLTKYTYGAVTVTAVVLNELVQVVGNVRHGSRSLPWRRWAALFAPLAVVLLFWLARPGSLSGALDYAQPLSDGNAWLSWRGFAYYPLSLARFETPAPLFALVNLAGLAWALANWRKPGIQLLLGYFLVGMALIMFINHPFNPRFIATFVPALHVVTAVMLTNLLLPLRHRWRQAVPLLLGGLLLLAGWQSAQTLPQRFALFGSRLEVEYETQPVLNELAAWLEEEISPNGRFLLINPWDQFSAEAMSWRLAAEHQISWIVPSVVLPPVTAESVTQFRQQIQQSEAQYVVVLEGSPWGAAAWPDYTAVLEDGFDEKSRHAFTVPFYELDDWLNNHQPTVSEWESVKANGRRDLHIQAIIYAKEN